MPTARTPEPLVRPYRFKPEQRSYARDIDTYVRPQSKQIGAPTGPTNAERLAASLRATSPILQEYFEKQEAKRKAALIAEGERLQKESGKRDWNEWVREHPEHEKYSPWVREGFEKQAAIAYGADYQTYMQELAATDESLAAMTDPAQIDEYLSEKTAEYMRDKLGHLNDRAVQQQFIAFANETRAAIGSQFMDKRLTEQLNEKTQMYQTAVVKLADSFTVGNMETLITADDATVDMMAAQLAAQLSMHAQNTILDVSNPKRVNDATIEAAFTWYNGVAPEYEEFAQKVIENLTGRDGAKLLGIVRYQEGWEQVKKQKFNDMIQQERNAVFLEQRQEEENIEAARAEYYDRIAANPLADHTQLVLEAGDKYGTRAQEVIRGWASACFSGASQRYNFFKSDNRGRGSTENAVREYSLFSRGMDGLLSEAEISAAVAENIISAKEGIMLREQIKNPNPEETAIITATMRTTLNAAGLPEKSSDYTSADLDKSFKIESDYRHELLLFKMEFKTENGRAPTREEVQQHFVKFADEQNRLIEAEEQARLKREAQDTAYLEDLTKRAKTLSFTPEQFDWIMNDYQRKGASSVISTLRAASGPIISRMTDTDFIIEAARRSGISADELVSRYGIVIPRNRQNAIDLLYNNTQQGETK